MAQKSERFEMRMDEDILARVDRWRSSQTDLPSRAEAMRRLVEVGLSRELADTVRYSDGEKLLIMMMRDLYKNLKLQRGEIDPDFVAEVILGGHYWAPKWEMPGLYHDHEDDPTEVRFVVDVLDMWSFIESAFAKLTKKDKDRIEKEVGPIGRSVKFIGFDGNNETTLMGIALFFVNKMGRFSLFHGRDMNSHTPMASNYRRMLSVFGPMRAGLVGTDLSARQIIAILQARSPSA